MLYICSKQTYNMKNKYYNHQYFDEINDEIKAYLLGFFIADGYLHSQSNRFGVSIQENDKIILEYYQKMICDNPIYTKNRTTTQIKRLNQSTFRWSSKHMNNIFQNKYKITANKTYDNNFKFPFETIPDQYIRHFIRGFIDGDGSFESNGNIFTINLISTSLIFLKQIGNFICNLENEIEMNIKEIQGKTIKYYRLRFNMFRKNKPEKVLKIYNYLYQDSELYLQRKKDKIESYLKYRGKL